MVLACAGSVARAGEPTHPILLIGVDGMDWRIVTEMIRDGELPVLKRLMQEGAFGKLETMSPTWSPVLWTTIATGKLPEKHGILGFAKGGKDGRLYGNPDRKTKALWNIFSDENRTVQSIGWWMTYPAEPIRGTMVAQTNTLAQVQAGTWKGSIVPGLENQVTPTSFQGPVLEIAADVQANLTGLAEASFGKFETPLKGLGEQTWHGALWAFRADTIYLRVVEKLMSENRQPFDLLMVYFGGADVMGHRFWRYAYPEEFEDPPEAADQKNFSKVIRNTYAYTDRAIGRILDLVGADAEPTVLVVSDHGMHAANREKTFSPERFQFSGHHQDAPPGVLIASGEHIRKRFPDGEMDLDSLPVLGSVRDVTPTILALEGLPIGRDMDGKILEGILEEGFLESHPPKYVETLDDPGWDASRTAGQLSDEAREERRKQLRALGYIE